MLLKIFSSYFLFTFLTVLHISRGDLYQDMIRYTKKGNFRGDMGKYGNIRTSKL